MSIKDVTIEKNSPKDEESIKCYKKEEKIFIKIRTCNRNLIMFTHWQLSYFLLDFLSSEL